MTDTKETPRCPSCGTGIPAGTQWQYCGACGAALAGAACRSCKAPLTPGAEFCHRCGTPVAGGVRAKVTADKRTAGMSMWGVAGLALLALFALLAGRSLLSNSGIAPNPETGMPLQGTGRAMDISQMSPEERAERLYNRVMLLASQGKGDSVAFFAPMAIEAYQMIGRLDEDQHYDVGRIAAVAGALPLARAHADSILSRSPNHLLGLILAAEIAEREGRSDARAEYERRMVAAEARELQRAAPEYERHRDEITAALAAARSRTR